MCPRDAATARLAERDSVTAWEASSPRKHRTLSFNRELVVSFCTGRTSRPLDLQRRHVLSYEAGVSPPIAGVTSRTATQHRAADTAVASIRASPRCPGACPSTYVAVVFRLIICFRLVPGLTPVTPAVGGGGSRTPAAPLPLPAGGWGNADCEMHIVVTGRPRARLLPGGTSEKPPVGNTRQSPRDVHL